MKHTAYWLAMILLTLLAGCGTTDPDIPGEGWIQPEACDFPVYVGRMMDYEHTDAGGHALGTVDYGGTSSVRDWLLHDYEAGRGDPIPLGLTNGNRDEYYVCVKAWSVEGGCEIDAHIYFDTFYTGFTTPHTFTFQGSYDPSLEGRYRLYWYSYAFDPLPVVSFDPDSNTYTYMFQGHVELIIPPLPTFMLSITMQNHVLLDWMTHCEIGMLGFRIHRAESNDILASQPVNSELVPATNTPEAHGYSYTDTGVQLGTTYFYWLEHVFSEEPANFYGPVSISTPPAVNQVLPAYPNPCTDDFNIDLNVKVGANATLVLLDASHTIHHNRILATGYHHLYFDVDDLDPGLYRVYIWFDNNQYSYGDVLIQ